MGSLELARRHLAGCGPADDYRKAAKRAYPYAPTFVGHYIGRLLRAHAQEHKHAGLSDEAGDAENLALVFELVPNAQGDGNPRFGGPMVAIPPRAFELAASEATALVAVGATGPAALLLDVLWEGKAAWAKTLAGSIGSPGDIAKRYVDAARQASLGLVTGLPGDAGGVGAAMAVADLWTRAVGVAISVKQRDFLPAAASEWSDALAFVSQHGSHWTPRHVDALLVMVKAKDRLSSASSTWTGEHELREAIAALEGVRRFAVREEMALVIPKAIAGIKAARAALDEPVDPADASRWHADDLLEIAARKPSYLAKTMFMQQAVPHLQQAGERERAAKVLAEIRGNHDKAVEAGEFKTVEFDSGTVDTRPLEREIEGKVSSARDLAAALDEFAGSYRIPGLDHPRRFAPPPSIVSQIVTRLPVVSGGRTLKPIAPGTAEAQHAADMDHLLIEMSVCTGLAFPIWIAKITQKFQPSASDYVDYIDQRLPTLTDDDRRILARGFGAYNDGDHIVAMHILVPRIEQVFRGALLAHPDGDATGFSDGSLKEATFGTLIQRAKDCGLVDQRLLTYVKMVLTEEGAGLNLRNRVAHGLVTVDECSPANLWRVVHLLLRFAVVVGPRMAAVVKTA